MSPTHNHQFDVVDSTLLVDAPIIALRRDAVRMPGGTIANREVVEHFGAVAVVAFDGESIAMVYQFRQSVGRRLWELPAGLLDIANESELIGAQRELAEEAGLAAASWSVVADLVTSPGFCDEAVRVFLAQDLSEIPRPMVADDEEADMTLEWIPLQRAQEMVLAGKIVNSIAIAGIFAAAMVVSGRGSARPVDADFDYRPQALAQRRQVQGIVPDMKKR